MKTVTVSKFAASALVIGTVAVGCTPDGSHVASVATVAPTAERQAASQAELSVKALREHRLDEAVSAGESAVSLAPQNAAYRAQLGQAYLQAGRFASAETAFRDLLTLDPANARVELNLALAQVALGKSDEARGHIAMLQGKVPEADRGLALALAGDREGAVPVLEAAARAPGADAKARQNLALAYALVGRWQEAQSAAAQDLPPQELFPRLQQWALFAQPHGASDQVAQLLSVTPAQDPGQPVALALAADPTAVPTAVAEAAPAQPEVPVAEAAPVPADLPSDAVGPVVAQAPALPSPAPVPVFLRASAPQAAPLLRAPRSPMRVAATAPAPVRQSAGGRYVVQLGAFSSSANVQSAWERYSRQAVLLADYTPSSARFRRAGGVVHRLTLSGFENRNRAAEVCVEMHAHGTPCFVRTAAGEQPVEWVSRSRGIQLAARR